MKGNEPDLEQLRAVDAYTLADAARRLKTGAVLDHLRPVTSCSSFVGRAITARIDYQPNESIPLSDYGVGTLLDQARQGSVLVLDGGGLPLTALGDLAMAMLKRQGAVAALVNARVRDVEVIETMAFPVFALNSGITTLAGHARIVDIGRPVSLYGIGIATGDLVAGCRGGVLVSPWEEAGAILQEARRIAATDQQVLEGILAGKPLAELWQSHKTQKEGA